MFASVVMRVKGKTIRLLVLILILLYKCLAAFDKYNFIAELSRNGAHCERKLYY